MRRALTPYEREVLVALRERRRAIAAVVVANMLVLAAGAWALSRCL